MLVDYVPNVCKQIVYCWLNIPYDMTNTVFPTFQTQYIIYQQTVAEHWDLPSPDIFQSKDVASEAETFWHVYWK
jgi:hypothetical protein